MTVKWVGGFIAASSGRVAELGTDQESRIIDCNKRIGLAAVVFLSAKWFGAGLTDCGGDGDGVRAAASEIPEEECRAWVVRSVVAK